MGRLIEKEKLIAEYDRVHVGPPGGARKLMEEAEEVPAITMEWIGEYLAWLKGIGGFGLSDARAIQSMIIKWKMDNPQKHSGCGPDYCDIGGEG